MQSIFSARFNPLVFVLFLGSFIPVLTGCGSTKNLPINPLSALNLKGLVQAGKQPISNSELHLYATGSTGDGSDSTELLSQPFHTDSNGEFSISVASACPSPTSQVYLVAKGGNPHLSSTSNSAIELMASLGACSNLSALPFTTINEVTTVGSIWPLAPYAKSVAQIGSGNADAQAFDTAAENIPRLISVANGSVAVPKLAAGEVAPTAKLNMLANMLAACVNSGGGSAADGSPCGRLFSYASSADAPPPADTIAAALAIAQNPTRNVAEIFDISPSNGAYQPVLPSPPADWTLPILSVPAVPTISPDNGTLMSGQAVSISEQTSDADVYYTTDGSLPSTTSQRYSGPIALPGSGTVSAMAVKDSLKSVVVTRAFKVLLPVSIALTGGNVALSQSQSHMFTATVTNASNPAVSWSLNPAEGSISSAGLYTAPSSVASAHTVTVTATSVADKTKSASVTVSLSAPPTSLARRPTSSAPASSFTYYVDSVNGKDSNPGTLSAPWKTIARANAATLTPGQSVGFKRGGMWRETLAMRQSGTAAAPIVFGAYGTGSQPIITGSDIVSGFVADPTAGVWDAPVATAPTAVWIDGIALQPPVGSKAGLTSQNKWFWQSGTLYIYSSSNPSSGHTVEAAVRTNAIYVNRVNYITLADMEVRNANKVDIFLNGSTHVIVQNMTIHDAPDQAVYVGLGGGGDTIQNCEIYKVALAGTFGTGSGIQLNGQEAPAVTIPSIIQNNYIHDLGNTAGGDHAIYDEVAGDIDRYNHFKNITGATAMKVDGDGILVYGNVFENIPSGGVWIDAYSNVKIYNNTFYNVGTVTPYAAVSFSGDGNQSGVSVENNIDDFPGNTYSIFLSANTSAVGLSSNYNDVFGALYASWCNGTDYQSLADWTRAFGQDRNSIAGDPLFTNPSASQFGLATGSPAIGAGIAIPGVTTASPPNMGAK